MKYYSALANTTFPNHSSSYLRIDARLSSALQDIRSSDLEHNIGTLYPKANRYATRVYASFLPYNPNNLGNWSTVPNTGGTRQLEYEVVHKLIDLYHAKKKNIEGYVTGGGTEGNLYSVWLAKTYLLSHVNIDKICIIKTKLTHYSIDKASAMCSIPLIEIPMNEQTWTIDVQSLKSSLLHQIKYGKKGFIISLTQGYTETGTSDDIHAITLIIKNIRKQHQDVHISIIIDAAYDGLVLPFISNNFSPFTSQFVHAYSIDFSKFTAVPYPAGVILYRKNLRQLIEKDVPVFSIKDNTLTGSRPGAPVAAIWAVIHRYGKDTFKKIILNQLKLKKHFITQMKLLYPSSEIISSPHSLTCGIILHNNKTTIFPKVLENKYWLYAKNSTFTFSNGKKRSIVLYKFFFMQHVTERSINDFFEDIHKLTIGKSIVN